MQCNDAMEAKMCARRESEIRKDIAAPTAEAAWSFGDNARRTRQKTQLTEAKCRMSRVMGRTVWCATLGREERNYRTHGMNRAKER